MKAFDHVTRGPQDATRVDRVKEVHGDSSARYLLHFHAHGPVYAHRSDTSRWGLIAGIVQLPIISPEKALWGTWHTKRCRGPCVHLCGQTGNHFRVFEKTLNRKTSRWHQNNDLLSEMDKCWLLIFCFLLPGKVIIKSYQSKLFTAVRLKVLVKGKTLSRNSPKHGPKNINTSVKSMKAHHSF